MLFHNKSSNLTFKDKRIRTILSPETLKITFTRIRYLNFKTKKYEYLLDRTMDIDKNKLVNIENYL